MHRQSEHRAKRIREGWRLVQVLLPPEYAAKLDRLAQGSSTVSVIKRGLDVLEREDG